MKNEILQKIYPPLKLAEVGKSYQHCGRENPRFVSTAGNVSSETIKWYVDTQKTRP